MLRARLMIRFTLVGLGVFSLDCGHPLGALDAAREPRVDELFQSMIHRAVAAAVPW